MLFVLFGLLIVALSVGTALMATRGVLALLRQRIQTKLLRTVIARAAGGFVVLCGVYLILRVSNLTQLALTLVGGTGLILGIAFRDITENFLSSIFLSIQQPFETGDLVEISGVTGGREHSWLKVRSSVIRLVKRAFQNQGFTMPDKAREVVFPQGIPVTLLHQTSTDARGTTPGLRLPAETRQVELEDVSTKAEAGLYSESIVIEEQAREARPLKDADNLLPVASGTAIS